MSGCNRIHEFNRMYYILYFCEYQCPQLLISDSPQNAFLTRKRPPIFWNNSLRQGTSAPIWRSSRQTEHSGLSWQTLPSFPKPPLHSDTFRYASTRSPGIRRNVVASDLPFRKTTVTTTTNGWVGLIGSKSGKPTRMASHGSHGTFTLGRFRRVEAEAPSLGFSAQGSLKKRWKVKRLIATVHLFMI